MDVQPKQGPVEWITRMSVEKLRGFVSKNGNAPRLQTRKGAAPKAHAGLPIHSRILWRFR